MANFMVLSVVIGVVGTTLLALYPKRIEWPNEVSDSENRADQPRPDASRT